MNIILAHGIFGFDRIRRLKYFNGIEEYLEGKYEGVKVLTTRVDPTDSIKTRGERLREQILAALGQTGQPPSLNPANETHIIAHSMGGLDSRYILSPDNKENIAEFVTSLTTIGTPHKGSPIADLFYKPLDGGSVWKVSIRNSLKIAGISTEGLRDLTTHAMSAFNAKCRDNANVKYFWIAGIGRSSGFATSAPFLLLHKYIRYRGKSNDERISDGVVPLLSAKREAEGWEPIGNLWNADHADEVGHDLNKYLSPFGIVTAALRDEAYQAPPQLLARYDEIIARVAPLKKR
jgi:triacylglycerol lipase